MRFLRRCARIRGGAAEVTVALPVLAPEHPPTLDARARGARSGVSRASASACSRRAGRAAPAHQAVRRARSGARSRTPFPPGRDVMIVAALSRRLRRTRPRDASTRPCGVAPQHCVATRAPGNGYNPTGLLAFAGAAVACDNEAPRGDIPRSTKPIRRVLCWQAVATVAIAAARRAVGRRCTERCRPRWAAWSTCRDGRLRVRDGIGIVRPASARTVARAVLRAEACKILVIILQLWLVLAMYKDVVLAALFAALRRSRCCCSHRALLDTRLSATASLTQSPRSRHGRRPHHPDRVHPAPPHVPARSRSARRRLLDDQRRHAGHDAGPRRARASASCGG